MAKSRHTYSHRACLVAPHRRGQYARAVQDWLELVLPLYGPDNLKRRGYGYVAQDDTPPHFEYASGEYRWSLKPAPPTQMMLANHGDYKKVRRQILDLAVNLLREARPADQTALRQRIKDEAL